METSTDPWAKARATNRLDAWIEDVAGGNTLRGFWDWLAYNEGDPSGYTVMENAAPHTCWEWPVWDGLMSPACAGCVQAANHPCRYCGYGEGFTTHNDLAHVENGDPQVPDDDDLACGWHNSPHLYAS